LGEKYSVNSLLEIANVSWKKSIGCSSSQWHKFEPPRSSIFPHVLGMVGSSLKGYGDACDRFFSFPSIDKILESDLYPDVEGQQNSGSYSKPSGFF
jgi:hypothetical protein